MIRSSRKINRARKCPICVQDLEVDYKDPNLLRKFISERGKILGRARTGVCARHQRALTRSIKRARYVALLAFVQS